VKKSPKTPKPVEHNVPIKILPSKHKPHSHCSSNKLTMGLPEVESGHMKSSPKICKFLQVTVVLFKLINL